MTWNDYSQTASERLFELKGVPVLTAIIRFCSCAPPRWLQMTEMNRSSLEMPMYHVHLFVATRAIEVEAPLEIPTPRVAT